jgi:hypothetical protein
MPDPLLTQPDFEQDYQTSERIAEFYGVSIHRQNQLVFLDCRNEGSRVLHARIDCTNYPGKPPDVTFLNPLTRRPTTERHFWPSGVSPIGRPGVGGLCLAGTATYQKYHQTGMSRQSLYTLVELVILCCKGQAAKLRLIPGR